MGRRVKNLITGQSIEIPEPIDEEVEYDGKVMITETDTAGIITYANRKFIELTGYTKEETIGSPHNINRHPDMPKAAFKDMWTTLKSGKPWEGLVKNLNQDGRYYNVLVWAKPKFDDNDKIIGYIAGRKIADKDAMTRALAKYAKMKEQE
ncbi:MAG: PAS domain-containing protein [Campylobacterota bacterium]|nr:PAS domain-containing protein [Campylobacterota bacterium]